MRISIAYYSKDPPCAGCKSRVIGCHAKCEKYQEYAGRCKEARETAAKEKESRMMQIEQALKVKKRRGIK